MDRVFFIVPICDPKSLTKLLVRAYFPFFNGFIDEVKKGKKFD